MKEICNFKSDKSLLICYALNVWSVFFLLLSNAVKKLQVAVFIIWGKDLLWPSLKIGVVIYEQHLKIDSPTFLCYLLQRGKIGPVSTQGPSG